MKYKTVPAMPGLSFSAVGFGCWGISGSDFWNGTTDAESIRTVQTAVDLGINLFDVAPVYGLGHAEEILGQALKGRRHEVIIASKCGLVWDEDKNISLNLKKASLMQEIDDSLRRLQTGYIDIYQMHWPDPDTPEEESMEALEAIKASDKIRHIGVTNFSLERTKRCMSAGTITSHQGLYNLLEHNPTHYHNIPLEYRTSDEVLPFCAENGLAFFPYSPLFQGLLTEAFKATDNFDENDARAANPKLTGNTFDTYFTIATKIRKLSAEIGQPVNQLAINWLINQDAVTSVIAGGQTVEHVTQNAAAASWDLSNDVIALIDQILAPHQVSGLV